MIELDGLQELNQEELGNIAGGGWLADAVASAVSYVKCGCWLDPLVKAYSWASFTVTPQFEHKK